MINPPSTPQPDAAIQLATLILKTALVMDVPPPVMVTQVVDLLAAGADIPQILRILLQTDLRQMTETRIKKNQPLYAEPEHFYSPHIDPVDAARELERASRRLPPPGVDLNEAAQRALWASFRPYIADFDPPSQPVSGRRYYEDNDFYRRGDAFVLQAMLRHFQPQRYIEIGSGFSSAFALDTIERYLANRTHCTFIEPFPAERLDNLLTDADRQRTTIIIDKVQHVDLSVFAALEPNDILFIDSSHVLKTGSDLCYELFDILPVLKPGVLVQFHDINYPFEYNANWALEERRDWNETYALRAFMQYNNAFEILFFNDMLACELGHEIAPQAGQLYGGALAATGPWSPNLGGGIWLRRR